MILRISGKAITPISKDVTLGHEGDSYHVKVHNIPKGISTPQVVVLFANTVKRFADQGLRYQYDFIELCPIGMLAEVRLRVKKGGR